MRSDQPGAADDQPPVASDDLSDLRLILLGVAHDRLQALSWIACTALANRFLHAHTDGVRPPGRFQALEDFGVAERESARNSLMPLAPVRATRAISSSQKRCIRLLVFADPLR
jgi:hypothetical protein